jgi:hypothetical protein
MSGASPIAIEWDSATVSDAHEISRSGQGELTPGVLERAIRELVVDPLEREGTVAKISISEVAQGSTGVVVRGFVEVDAPPGPFRAFWQIAPDGAGGWRLDNQFRRSLNDLRQLDGVAVVDGLATFGTVNTVEREWPPPTQPERRFLLTCRWGADGPTHQAVLRWAHFPSEEAAVRALRRAATDAVEDANPVDVQVVELLPPFPTFDPGEPPDPHVAVSGRASRLLRRSVGIREQRDAATLAAWYADSRGMELDPTGETPRGTWALSKLVESRSHSFIRGPLADGLNGTLFYGERALHSSRGNLWEEATVAVCSLGSADRLSRGLACLWRSSGRLVHMHDPLPDGLSEVRSGHTSVDERHIIGIADPAAADQVRALYGDGFATWIASLPWDEHSLRFELVGQLLCAYVPRALSSAAELDALRANTAMIAKRLQVYDTWSAG